jgi:hypothetical protein
MTSALEWTPAPHLLEKITQLAQQRGQSPELIMTEAIESYLQAQTVHSQTQQDDDPLIGLFAGSPNLADHAEDILQQEITSASGWTWKQP